MCSVTCERIKKEHRMTLDEFYARVRKLRRKWTLEVTGINKFAIRTSRRCQCPIIAVYASLSGNSQASNSAAKTYGRALGLDDRSVNLIIVATDKKFTPTEAKYRRVRKKLLEATGLAT